MSTQMSTRSQCKKEAREVSDEAKEKKRDKEEAKPVKDAPSRPARQNRNKTKGMHDVHHDEPGEQTPAEKKLAPRTRKDIKESFGKELKEDATASGVLTRTRRGKRATSDGPTAKKDVVKSDGVKQEKEVITASTLMGRGRRKGNRGTESETKGNPVVEETPQVKEYSEAKGVSAKGRGKKWGNRGPEIDVQWTPLTEDAPHVKEETQENGVRAKPTAKGSEQKSSNKGPETGIKETLVPKDASIIKEDPEDKVVTASSIIRGSEGLKTGVERIPIPEESPTKGEDQEQKGVDALCASKEDDAVISDVKPETEVMTAPISLRSRRKRESMGTGSEGTPLPREMPIVKEDQETNAALSSRVRGSKRGNKQPKVGSEEKGVNTAPTTRGRGKKFSYKCLETSVKGASLIEDGPMVKEESEDRIVKHAPSARASGKNGSSRSPDTTVAVPKVPKETSNVKEGQDEKGVNTALPVRGRGKKIGNKGPYNEDAPIVKKESEEKGVNIFPTARGNGKKNRNKGPEADIEWNSVTEEIPTVKEDTEQKGIDTALPPQYGPIVKEESEVKVVDKASTASSIVDEDKEQEEVIAALPSRQSGRRRGDKGTETVVEAPVPEETPIVKENPHQKGISAAIPSRGSRRNIGTVTGVEAIPVPQETQTVKENEEQKELSAVSLSKARFEKKSERPETNVKGTLFTDHAPIVKEGSEEKEVIAKPTASAIVEEDQEQKVVKESEMGGGVTPVQEQSPIVKDDQDLEGVNTEPPSMGRGEKSINKETATVVKGSPFTEDTPIVDAESREESVEADPTASGNGKKSNKGSETGVEEETLVLKEDQEWREINAALPTANKEDSVEVKQKKELMTATTSRGSRQKRDNNGPETSVEGNLISEETPIVKDESEEKEVKPALLARVSGRKRGNRVTKMGAEATPLLEETRIVKEDREQEGVNNGLPSRGREKKRGNKETETGVKGTLLTEDATFVKDDQNKRDIARGNGKKRRQRVTETAIKRNLSEVDDEISGEDVKLTASKTADARNKQEFGTEKELVKGGDVDNHGSPQKRRRGPGTKKDVSDKRTWDDDPSSPTRKRTKRGQASSSKTLSSVRSMDNGVDDVTSDVMSEKEPVANFNKEPVSYLKKEPSAYLKKEPNANLKKQQISKLSEKSPNAKFVGAHCSIAGGLVNAVRDAVSIKATSFALFLRSQRQWHAKPLEEKDAKRFREACAEHGFPPHLILPHGSYLLNCGSPNEETLSKSRAMLQDEMSRCEKLGLTLYNFHPGSTCGQMPVEECLDKIAESVNMALAKTSGVTAVLENMSCQGNTVGGRFEELRAIIDRVQDKTRVGVCLDTCHAFAAGYDLSTEAGFQQMTSDFDRIVGFKYLRAMHVNDSKGEAGCHLDRHENIGKGKIGLEGFRRVMNDPQFNNIPLILETPPDFGYLREIKTLNSLMT